MQNIAICGLATTVAMQNIAICGLAITVAMQNIPICELATTVVSPMFANSGPRKEVAYETADVLTAFERYSDAIRLPFEAK